jgi:Skp family chaperone for outer membrane proteins
MTRSLLAAAALLAATMARAEEPEAHPPQGGLKIGVVNIVRVFDELDEKIEMNAELRQIEEKRDARLQQLLDRVKELDGKAKLVRADSDEGRKILQELEDAKRDFRTYRDASEDHVYNKLFDFTSTIYKKIRQEIHACAAEAGYDLVLRGRDDDLSGFDQTARPRLRYMDLSRRIEAHNVLFAKPTYDFTDAIIKRMNDRHQRTSSDRRPPAPRDAPEK